MWPLGQFGDNHVTPTALFDSRDPSAGPPPDALDVQFRVPSSLNTMLDGMAQAGREDLLDQWRRLYLELAEDTARFLQHAGYGVDRQRSGAAPSRLAITPVVHASIPGFGVARWHAHLYVGAHATSLIDGQVLPVARDNLATGLDCIARAYHAREVEERTSALWDLRWDRPRPGAAIEIVEPPWHEHIESLERGVCPGPTPYPRLETWVADDGIEARAVEAERQIAHDNATGRGLVWAKLMFEDDEDELPEAAGS